MNLAGLILSLLSLPFLGRGIHLTLRDGPLSGRFGSFAIANWLASVGNAIGGNLWTAAISGACAVWMTWLWWKNRRKGRGRKALKELGDKSRRRVQALADRISPSPIPSPGGAR